MARKTPEQMRRALGRPTWEIRPGTVKKGDYVVVSGSGWPECPVTFEIDGRPVRPDRILLGLPVPGGLRPAATGDFIARLATHAVEPGHHKIGATSTHPLHRLSAAEAVQVLDRPMFKLDGRVSEPPYWRSQDFFTRRFGHIAFVPPGVRETQLSQVRALRLRIAIARERMRLVESVLGKPVPGFEPAMPNPAVCNWNPVGAGPVPKAQTEGSPTQPVSGRLLAIAIDPATPSTVYVGTANGGVWKSTDGGTTWSPKTDYARSLAIRVLAIDPNNSQRVYAGTGEYYNLSVGTYYGNGILKSEDGGTTWTELATSTFERDEISQILFDPTDATSQRMFLSSSIGVYESTDGGANWTLLRSGSASGLVTIVSTGPPTTVQLIAPYHASGLWTSTRTGTTWSAWTQLASAAFPASFGRIALGQSRSNPLALYGAFASTAGGIAGMAKTTDGGQTWAAVTPPLWASIDSTSSPAGADNHMHGVVVPQADLAAPAAKTYTTTSAGSAAHTHTVSLTQAEMQTLAGGTGSVPKNTDADASGHQHGFTLDRRRSGQTWYNFHVAVHPTNPNVVYYGEVRLWRTSTGDGPWTDVTDGEPVGPPPAGTPIGIHVDQHAFAFDPVDPNRIWAGNDGGVYRSTDAGATWAHRNRDLGTLQYMHVSLHPQWEAVMLGGTQDNGTHRYSGNPAWEFSAAGDGGFTAIDPANPTRMYHGYVRNWFYRSDDAGAPGSWTLKTGSITGAVEFYPPFVLDPSNSNVCYFGNNRLWRSADNADTWTAITAALVGNITAIAVHPADANTIYAATSSGGAAPHVYRVQRTGPTWAQGDVTTTDLTGANLPTAAGVYLSDLAVDPSGTVWVTVSSVLWTESTGEFTNDHVYRRTPSGTNWETRSNGLAQANPINTIVIDPTNDSRLFCGGDIGAFRTEDAGGTWVPWDEGLPNAPVFHLAIHGPRRLLRAATHGRSVWERPIDTPMCPMVDLYLRDDILDTGRVQPSPSGQPHPFTPSTYVYWWQSVDIKVDAPEPNFQTPSPVGDYVAFEADLQHRTARRGVVNRFYVQVHNRGVAKATNVKVRAFFANASGGLPLLPSDFWSAGKPFDADPSGADWTPVGPTSILPVLEPAEPGVVEWDWLVPSTAAQHSCLLAVATCTEDPLNAAGIFDLGNLVPNRKQATLKNLNVGDAVPGQPMPPEQAFVLELHNPLPQKSRFDLVFRLAALPKRTRLFVAFERPARGEPPLPRDVDLRRLGVKANDDVAAMFPDETESGCGNVHRFARGRVYELSPTKDGTATFPGVLVPSERPLAIAMNLILPAGAREPSGFDVVQQSDRRVVGGSSYLLRPKSATG